MLKNETFNLKTMNSDVCITNYHLLIEAHTHDVYVEMCLNNQIILQKKTFKIAINILFLIKTSLRSHIVCLYLHIEQGLLNREIQLNSNI